MLDRLTCYIKQDKLTRELVNWWSSIFLTGRLVDNDEARSIDLLIVTKLNLLTCYVSSLWWTVIILNWSNSHIVSGRSDLVFISKQWHSLIGCTAIYESVDRFM